ncbi:MAG: anti-sigma factor domain-containing protein [Acidimicrobiia bacterium]
MSYPHDEHEDRVIARALDVDTDTDTDEAAMDRATLDEYRQVLAHLPFDEVAPPAELEDRVFAAALETRPAAVPSIGHSSARKRAAARWVTLGAAVAAAAAVVTFMFTTSNDTTPVRGTVDPIRADFPLRDIINDPEARNAVLLTEGEGAPREAGQVALTPEGEGAIVDLTLPATTRGEVVWVWLVVDDTKTPIGVLRDPTVTRVRFDVTGDATAVDGLEMSVEQLSNPTPDQPGPVIARATF